MCVCVVGSGVVLGMVCGRMLRSGVYSTWLCVDQPANPSQAATAGTGMMSPTSGQPPCGSDLLSLRAARSSAFAAYLAPPYDATAMAQATACLRNAVCVQLAHVLAWLSNQVAKISSFLGSTAPGAC